MKPIFKYQNAVAVANDIEKALEESLEIYEKDIKFRTEESDDAVYLYMWDGSASYIMPTVFEVTIEVLNLFVKMYGDMNIWTTIDTTVIESKHVEGYRRPIPRWEIRIAKNK